jgi:hypothetical protein
VAVRKTPGAGSANYRALQTCGANDPFVDTKLLVATYAHYYPLLQEAYENLGHPPQYFNDRVIEVIDHLLTTPELPDPIALVQPGVQYQFADPKLDVEIRGQKVVDAHGSRQRQGRQRQITGTAQRTSRAATRQVMRRP